VWVRGGGGGGGSSGGGGTEGWNLAVSLGSVDWWNAGFVPGGGGGGGDGTALFAGRAAVYTGLTAFVLGGELDVQVGGAGLAGCSMERESVVPALSKGDSVQLLGCSGW